ncbi:MAG: hypothetical protein RR434_06870 [Raoultibacter sp.]
MNRRPLGASLALCVALAACVLAPLAFANEAPATQTSPTPPEKPSLVVAAPTTPPTPSAIAAPIPLATSESAAEKVQKSLETTRALAAEKQAERSRLAAANKELSCDPALLAAIGTQETSGHSICCSAFACAYGDAFVKGTANNHAAYGCTMCTWPGWGGGNSSFRDLGSSSALLREAYDQIAAGKPTVVHVSASYGEHWITLIGYQAATDPDALTLANFIALDPWDGARITASDRFSLYGDNCQHISSAQ